MSEDNVSHMNDKRRKYRDNVSDIEIYEPEWIDLTKVIARPQPWLWQYIIPLETSTLLAGMGGIGKSTFLLSLVSSVTNGQAFNCCGQEVILPKGSVILLAAEDREDTHLLPNLIAANADISKIHLIKSTVGTLSKKNRFLCLDKELHILERKIEALKNNNEEVKLIVIDPISYFIGDTKDHIQVEVSNFIQSLNDLARKYGAAIILNKHLRKRSGKQTFSSVVDEVGGSAAWVNTPRQSFAIMRHPMNEEKILMFNLKVNIAKKQSKALCYTIQEVDILANGKPMKATKLVWSDKLEDIQMDDAVNKETFVRSKETQAQELIYNYLKKNGVTSVEKIRSICKEANIASRTCQRAYLSMEKENTIKRSPGNYKTHFELVDGWDGDK